jgi:ferredoxin
VCLSLNYSAESLIRLGMAERCTAYEGLRILEQAKSAGLAQLGDNVQRGVAYICNCCGCCCEMLQGIRLFDIRGAIISSNWIMEVDAAACQGCGKCVDACPVSAVGLVEERGQKKPKKRAVCEDTLCLGCGVCYTACEFGAIRMKPRTRRVHTPETVYDRIVAMAIERGKLSELVFDNPQRLSHRALARIAGIIERSPPVKAALAVRPLRSAFLERIVAAAKRRVHPIHEDLDQPRRESGIASG